MHRIIYAVRQIPVAELPTVLDPGANESRAATDGELLSMGLQHLHEDFYSCAAQEQSNDDTDIVSVNGRLERVWHPVGVPMPGTVVSAGRLDLRYARLPADVHPKVMQADVCRSETVNVKDVVTASLAEQERAIEEYVGPIEGRPRALDTTSRDAICSEASRLAVLETNDIARVRVPMAEVAADDDVTIDDNLIPHHWAGERLR